MIVLLLTSTLGGQLSAQSSKFDLRDDQARKQTVQLLKAKRTQAKLAARQVAEKNGWRIEGKAEGGDYELMGIADGLPRYYTTTNKNAAISTAADQIRQTSPYFLSGFRLRIGVWDSGSVLQTHESFEGNPDFYPTGNRIVVKDGAESRNHSTHVGGTIAAGEENLEAMGMAPRAIIHSYDWDFDDAEMAAAAATTAFEGGLNGDKLFLSNHSYGQLAGWSVGNWSNTDGWHWWGVLEDREDFRFGQYNDISRTWDEICHNAPYFLPFVSAGNDRGNSRPTSGTLFYYFEGSAWQSKYFEPELDPYNDGGKQGGFNTVHGSGVAKNAMTIGSVNDATFMGTHSTVGVYLSSFSNAGPTDDGRIKPDLMANGEGLLSAWNFTDDAYGRLSGTSMSSPNAAGSALLLIEYYRRLFGGQAMRASTLKGLLIHTADDLSISGPDYGTGWGLMDVKAAADHIKSHADLPSRHYLIESSLDSEQPTETFTVHWDETSPLRATLCWTDPPGDEQSGLNNDFPVLINDLDLRITGPDGATAYFPYTLDKDSPDTRAGTGDNTLDPIEQVHLTYPDAPGAYTIEVSHKGSLLNDKQQYSLIVSGQRADGLAVEPLDDFRPSGPFGGPFSPISTTFELNNPEAKTMLWIASSSAEWAQLSVNNGELASQASNLIEVSLATNASALPPGEHVALLTFAGERGVWQVRQVTLTVRDVDSFSWSPVASPQIAQNPFLVKLAAVDSAGLAVTPFSDAVKISAWAEDLSVSGLGSNVWASPLDAYWKNARTQVIYHPAELLPAGLALGGMLSALALEVTAPPGQVLRNWTIRLRHTTKDKYSVKPTWENTGWTTVYQSDETIPAAGLARFDFTTPFFYNGTDNLMVDFSFNNSSWSRSGYSSYTQQSELRSIHARTDGGSGDPVLWSGVSPPPGYSTYLPNASFYFTREIPLSSSSTGNFTNGAWSGQLAVLDAVERVRLVTDYGATKPGKGSFFTVQPVGYYSSKSTQASNWMLYKRP